MRQASKRGNRTALKDSPGYRRPHAGIIPLKRRSASCWKPAREHSIAELCRKKGSIEPLLPLVEGVPGGGQETVPATGA